MTMYRYDDPPAAEERKPRLPFDLADVGTSGLLAVVVWLAVLCAGLLIGTFAAGVVVAFRALT